MPCANAVARSCVRPVANAVDAISGLSRPPGSLIYSDFMGGLGGADPLLGYSLLGGQYQDGVLVGLQPACDDLAFAGLPGVRGMRTCGAVTNLVPNSELAGVSSTEVQPAGWSVIGSGAGIVKTIVGYGPGYIDVRFAGTATAASSIGVRTDYITAGLGDSITLSMSVAVLFGAPSADRLLLQIAEFSSSYTWLSAYTKIATYNNKVSRAISNVSCSLVATSAQYDVVLNEVVDFTIRLRRTQVTKTAYPVPYIPTTGTDVTQTSTAHNGTTGIEYAMQQNGAAWNQLSTAKPLTLAARLVMGVGSAELPNSTTLNIRTCRSDPNRLLRIVKDSSGNCRVELHDGTNTAQSPITTWSRYKQLIVVGQVLHGGLQMRAGAKVGAGALSFGSAVTYAGSFWPDAVYSKLMLAHSNVYPVHTLKDWLADYQSSEADILAAMGVA